MALGPVPKVKEVASPSRNRDRCCVYGGCTPPHNKLTRFSFIIFSPRLYWILPYCQVSTVFLFLFCFLAGSGQRRLDMYFGSDTSYIIFAHTCNLLS